MGEGQEDYNVGKHCSGIRTDRGDTFCLGGQWPSQISFLIFQNAAQTYGIH